MWLVVYNILFTLIFLVSWPVFAVVGLVVRKRRGVLFRRLGFQSIEPMPDGSAPVWIHALSVGEVTAAVPLVHAWVRAHPDVPVVFSVSTKTGMETARAALEHNVARLVYFPLDLWLPVWALGRRIGPRACVIVESDLWPNFLSWARRRDIPVILVNGRVSPRSFAGYRRLGFFFRRVFGSLSAVGAVSLVQKSRFVDLGTAGNRVVVTGNLKADCGPMPDTLLTRPDLGLSDDEPVVVFGSTHPGEEEAVARALDQVREKISIRAVLAPRDPQRAMAVMRIIESHGFKGALLSEVERRGRLDFDVIVVDVLGRLAGLYGVGDVAFVGGSLKPFGGHNPLEPAFWGRPVITGPHMTDFAEIAEMFQEAGALIRVWNAAGLAMEIIRLLKEPEQARLLGERARAVAEANQGAVDKTITLVERFVRP